MQSDLVNTLNNAAAVLSLEGHPVFANDIAAVANLLRTGKLVVVDDGTQGQTMQITRARKAQDVSRWPSSMDSAAIEVKIDNCCGCAGRWDCNCVSVFNQVRADAWYDHNTKGTDHAG